jgi:hypothetical protein
MDVTTFADGLILQSSIDGLTAEDTGSYVGVSQTIESMIEEMLGTFKML